MTFVPCMDESAAAVATPASLVGDVDLLCLDAGNTVVFLDHARVARLAAAAGFATTAAALVVAEGAMKDALARDDMVRVTWSQRRLPRRAGQAPWGRCSRPRGSSARTSRAYSTRCCPSTRRAISGRSCPTA